MTTVQKVKVKREENSKWENAIEMIIHEFDAIQIIIDANGKEIDEYWECKMIIKDNVTITL